MYSSFKVEPNFIYSSFRNILTRYARTESDERELSSQRSGECTAVPRVER